MSTTYSASSSNYPPQNTSQKYSSQTYTSSKVYTPEERSYLTSSESSPLLVNASINGEDDGEPKELPSITYASAKGEEQQPKGNPKAIRIVLLTVVIMSLQFTLVMPSMYLYMKQYDASESFYGLVVAIYSVGSLLGSVLFGWIYDKRPARDPISVSICIGILGNVIYSLIGLYPHYAQWGMLVARFLVGFGSGGVAVCRAYCSEVTSLKNKVAMMAMVSGAQGIGFVIGPALGSGLSFLNIKLSSNGDLMIDSYTSPGYLSAICGIINLILVVLFLTGTGRRGKKAIVQSDDPLIPILIVLFMFFASVTVFAIFETDFTILSKRDFGWGTTKNSLYLLVAAILSTVAYIAIATPFFKQTEEKKATTVGFILLILGMLSFIVYRDFENKLSISQLIVGGVCFSFGYPIASTFMFALYSKILNPKVQGAKMGWITASGSLARMLGPIWATNALAFGDTVLFGGTALFLVFALLVLFACHRLLKPHSDYGKEIAASSTSNTNDSV